MENMQDMLLWLRFLAMVAFALLTVVFGILSLVSGFRYREYGFATKKTVRVSGMYMALSILSFTLTIIILDPSKTPAALMLLAMGLSSVVFYVGAGYFNLTLVEKGPRKMFAPVLKFLKRLFSRNSD